MKEGQDYIQDIAEIRSMMERSSKFMSLSGWAGIMAGVYALAGAYIAHSFFHFQPDQLLTDTENVAFSLDRLILLALVVLVMAIGTAILLSSRKAAKRGERAWNATSRRLIAHMAVPLLSGGLLILIVIGQGLWALIIPLTLIFYGLALYNASKFTYDEVKSLGILQIMLGLFSAYYFSYGLLFWAVGFGLLHIAYGIFMHLMYER